MTDSEQLDQWILKLKCLGLKLTGPRCTVIDVLTHTERALTAAEIYSSAHERYPSLGLVSVYRTLEKFEQVGLVQRVHQEDNCQAYIASPGGHTHFLVCGRCGKVSTFQGDDLKSLVRGIEQKSGYHVVDHLLQLVGVCADCQAADK